MDFSSSSDFPSMALGSLGSLRKISPAASAAQRENENSRSLQPILPKNDEESPLTRHRPLVRFSPSAPPHFPCFARRAVAPPTREKLGKFIKNTTNFKLQENQYRKAILQSSILCGISSLLLPVLFSFLWRPAALLIAGAAALRGLAIGMAAVENSMNNINSVNKAASGLSVAAALATAFTLSFIVFPSEFSFLSLAIFSLRSSLSVRPFKSFGHKNSEKIEKSDIIRSVVLVVVFSIVLSVFCGLEFFFGSFAALSALSLCEIAEKFLCSFVLKSLLQRFACRIPWLFLLFLCSPSSRLSALLLDSSRKSLTAAIEKDEKEGRAIFTGSAAASLKLSGEPTGNSRAFHETAAALGVALDGPLIDLLLDSVMCDFKGCEEKVENFPRFLSHLQLINCLAARAPEFDEFGAFQRRLDSLRSELKKLEKFILTLNGGDGKSSEGADELAVACKNCKTTILKSFGPNGREQRK